MATLSDDIDTWAQCDRCSKWRLLPASAFPLPAQWYCKMSTTIRNEGPWSCAVPEVATEADEAELAGDGCFVVGGLHGKRKRGHEVQYLVHWAGFTRSDDSWEPAANINADAIAAFESAQKALRKASRTEDKAPASMAPAPKAPAPKPPPLPPTTAEAVPTSRQFAMVLGKDKPTSTPMASLQLGIAPARGARVGSAYQVELRPVIESLQPPPAPPPHCYCSAAAVWVRERWFCATERSAGGCAFEAVPPPLPISPLCECGVASSWVPMLQRWCCVQFGMDGGCRFELAERQAAASTPVSHASCLSEMAQPALACFEMASRLQEKSRQLGSVSQPPQSREDLNVRAVSEWAFVTVTSEKGLGLGLFARQNLVGGQAIGEYGGPRLPLELLQPGKGTFVLQVSDWETFIDGNWEHCPYEGPRSLAVFANHSAKPNARFEHWPLQLQSTSCATQLRDRMWLVATEPIQAGAEIRVDYESGGLSKYWEGPHPAETMWRSVRMKPPPPSECTPTLNHLERVLRGCTALPVELLEDDPAPLQWEGPAGGDDRLGWVLQHLTAGCAERTATARPVPWGLVATHVPGRDALECAVRGRTHIAELDRARRLQVQCILWQSLLWQCSCLLCILLLCLLQLCFRNSITAHQPFRYSADPRTLSQFEQP